MARNLTMTFGCLLLLMNLATSVDAQLYDEYSRAKRFTKDANKAADRAETAEFHAEFEADNARSTASSCETNETVRWANRATQAANKAREWANKARGFANEAQDAQDDVEQAMNMWTASSFGDVEANNRQAERKAYNALDRGRVASNNADVAADNASNYKSEASAASSNAGFLGICRQ